MDTFLFILGISVLVLVILFGAPLIIAFTLSALFGWSFWLCFWLAFGLGLLFGGVKVTTN